MKYEEIDWSQTPHVVVAYRDAGERGDQFAFNVHGELQVFNLLGAITRTQIELSDYLSGVEDGYGEERRCGTPEPSLFIAYDPVAKGSTWFVSPGIPVDSLNGFLELLKSQIIATHAANQQRAQQMQPRVLGPNGVPYNLNNRGFN